MKKYTSLLASIIATTVIFIISYTAIQTTIGYNNLLNKKESLFAVDEILYPIMLVSMLFFAKDFIKKGKALDFCIFFYLGLCAFFRELGAQKWLTTTDTSITKIRFFTNSNNPISERLIAGIILATIFASIIYLMIKYVPKIIKGFFNKVPLYWTIAFFGGLGVLSKILDRFPGKYRKSTGEALSENIKKHFLFFEEVSEFCLPILVIIALIQYHKTISKKE